MYCRICPHFKYVNALVNWYYVDSKLLDEAYDRLDELRERCTSCHRMAAKNPYHLGPDRDGGRLHGEISFQEALFAPGQEQGSFTADREWLAHRRADTSTGCTASLDPKAEDELRQAVATVVGELDYLDAEAAICVLAKLPFSEACKLINKTPRQVVESFRRVLHVLHRAKFCFSRSENREIGETLAARIGRDILPREGPMLLALLKGDEIRTAERLAGLNRATGHARLVKMKERVAWVEKLRPR